MKRNRITRNVFDPEVKLESTGRIKMVRCKICGHRFSATFYRKDPNPNDVNYCPECRGCDLGWA
jgi:NAD-dependent SIR2 family protein deacetylase